MKPGFFTVGLLITGAILIASVSSARAAGNINLSNLTDDPATLNRLNALYSELLSRGLSDLQITFCLSQILFESGMLTGLANTGLMNQNNYAGLTATSGGYAAYNSISDFVSAYLGFLTKGSDPLDAASLSDFNNRLRLNGYYTESPAVYLAGLNTYAGMLFDASN